MNGSEDDGVHGEERASLEKELSGTVAVLVERISRLSMLDEQIHQLRYQMEKLTGAELVLRGDATAVVTRDAFRQTLRKKLVDLEKRRVEAEADVEKARERREMIEEEIEALTRKE